MDKGAHFYRCDFEVHTPRDEQWSGFRPVTCEDREKYARDFVVACRSKGLNAIAITDHHDFCFYPYIAKAAKEEVDERGEKYPLEEQLVVFPGLELTLAVPCQALMILDADFPEDRLAEVLQALNTDVIDPSLPSTGPTKVLDHFDSLKGLHDTLDLRSWLVGRYIILPNVTDGGHKTLLRKGFPAKYKDMPSVGGYVDGFYSKLGKGNRDIVEGRDKNYGSKGIAIFQASDSRSADFKDLGKCTSWVKWAAPTAEALRQACLAKQSRITQEPPELPNIEISRLSVSNSMFLGPIELSFNAQYSAIIGGRGTGKSTILDYLRWALCDLPPGPDPDEEFADPRIRQKRLITATLVPTDSSVEVHFSINSIPHVVRRYSKTGEVTLKVADQEFARQNEADIRELLPIQAYSQKQLSSVAVRVEELTRFVTAPIRRALGEVDRQIDESESRLRENYASVQRQRQLQSSIHRLEVSELSLAEQAKKIRESLVDLSDLETTILASKPRHDDVQNKTVQWEAAATRALSEAERLQRVVDALVEEFMATIEGTDDLGVAAHALWESLVGQLTKLKKSIDAAIADFRLAMKENSGHDKNLKAVESLLRSFETSYTAVTGRASANTSKLKELSTIETQQRETVQSLSSQRSDLKQLGRPDENHKSLLHARFVIMDERSTLLAEQCQDLSAKSDGLLRATLHRGQGLAAAAESLAGAVKGSGLRAAKTEGFFDELRKESSPLDTWEQCLYEFEALANREESSSEITTEGFPTLSRLGLVPADLKKLSDFLTADAWLTLAVTPITDHPSFEYQLKEDDFIEFSLASAGQQATALLTVLLAQTGSPLIIDQPEDDLDSLVIQEVVEKIWMAKRHRQLIFSSHNANLVVNGDSELVIHCDYRVQGEQSRGEIKSQGTIDLEEVRVAITKVMEGGEKAFKLRKEKYGF